MRTPSLFTEFVEKTLRRKNQARQPVSPVAQGWLFQAYLELVLLETQLNALQKCTMLVTLKLELPMFPADSLRQLSLPPCWGLGLIREEYKDSTRRLTHPKAPCMLRRTSGPRKAMRRMRRRGSPFAVELERPRTAKQMPLKIRCR